MRKKSLITVNFFFAILLFGSFIKPVFASSQWLDQSFVRANAMVELNPSESLIILQNYFFEPNNPSMPQKSLKTDEIEHYFNRAQILAALAYLNLDDQTQLRSMLEELKKRALSEKETFALIFLQLQLDEKEKQISQDKIDERLIQLISQLQTFLSQEKNEAQRGAIITLLLQSYLLQLERYNKASHVDGFEQVLQQINGRLKDIPDPSLYIHFLLQFSTFQTKMHYDSIVLSNLLHAYWLSIENSLDLELALVNQALANYYYEHSIFDKALEHANSAASFYQAEHYNHALNQITFILAQTYQKIGNASMALNNYINLLAAQDAPYPINKVNLYRAIIELYLSQNNNQQASFYLHHLEQMDPSDFRVEKNDLLGLFRAEIAFLQQRVPRALQLLNPLFNKYMQKDSSVQADPLFYRQLLEALMKVYVAQNDYESAWKTERTLESLTQKEYQAELMSAQTYFEQYQHLIEANLQINYVKQNKTELFKQLQFAQKTNLIFCFIILILFIAFLIRYSTTKQYIKMANELEQRLTTHARSGLKNLSSFYQPNHQLYSDKFLIQSPLTDKLIFLLFRFPLLTECYQYYGYQKASAIESAFGRFIKERLPSNHQIYQYNDDQFLHISPKATYHERSDLASKRSKFDRIDEIEQLIAYWKELIHQFIESQPSLQNDVHQESHNQNKHDEMNGENLNRKKLFKPSLSMAIVNYPFIPKAYSAINEQQLIDLLLMVCNQAQINSTREENGELETLEAEVSWIYLKTIKTAPVASFVNHNIREAALLAIDNGLLKVFSSKDKMKSTTDWKNQFTNSID